MSRPDFSLSGKVAVVTGASSGMGEEIAKQFAASGAKVVLGGRHEPRLQAVATAIRDEGGECHTINVDVNLDEAPKRMVKETVDPYGGLNILVPMAGIYQWGPFAETTVDSFDQQWATNVRAPYRLVQEALPQLRPDGVVLLCSSIAGVVGFPESVAYCATKGAVSLMCKAMAMELAGQ